MKHSIALKIFALAVGIIGLTVVVAILTNIEVIGMGRDVATVARKTIPLASKAADLNEAGLFRRVPLSGCIASTRSLSLTRKPSSRRLRTLKKIPPKFMS